MTGVRRKRMLTSEQRTVLYALRLIRLRWDDEADYAGLIITLTAMKEMKMLRVLDLVLLPGEFREVVMWTLKNRSNE